MRAPVLLIPLFAAAASIAEAAEPDGRFIYSNLTVARLNPLGLLELLEGGYQLRLYESESAVLKDNFVFFGLRPMFTPAWARVAGVLKIQPLSVLQLYAEYSAGGAFGTFGLMQSFTSADADYSDTIRRDLADAGTNYAATGTQIELGALLQAKVGPIAARSNARFIRPDHDLRAGDVALYDVVYDALIPNRGWALNKDTDLLWVSDFGLVAGARWTFTHVFARPADLSSPSAANPNANLHRVGPFLAYTFYKEPGARFDEPTVILIGNWWLKHPFRTGADVSQAVPYFVLGFRFTGELWRSAAE